MHCIEYILLQGAQTQSEHTDSLRPHCVSAATEGKGLALRRPWRAFVLTLANLAKMALHH